MEQMGIRGQKDGGEGYLGLGGWSGGMFRDRRLEWGISGNRRMETDLII